MSRLIDSEATEKEMLFWADTYGYGGLTKDNIREILRDAKKTPTVDATEVIRCKDCKYCDKGIDEDGKPFLKCLGWVYGGASETDFCSHAERRQE